MITEVRVRFDSSEIRGGARAILDPAGCGPDVASVEDVPALRQVVVWVTLEARDPRLPVLYELLKQHGEDWLEIRKDLYTEEELDAAPLIILRPQKDVQVFGGPRLGTTYDLADACPVCGAGARQTSALLIDGDDLPRLEGQPAASTYFRDILVAERLAERLGSLGKIGVAFRSVYAVMSDKRQVRLRWQQLYTEHTLLPMCSSSTGIERDPCARCGRSGFSPKMDDPPRIVYRARDLARIEDVNMTWEWFGDSDFDGDVSDALFPYPWMLVTPRVWRTFREAGVTSFDWLPIHADDSDE